MESFFEKLKNSGVLPPDMASSSDTSAALPNSQMSQCGPDCRFFTAA
jgi:hypothetical protein